MDAQTLDISEARKQFAHLGDRLKDEHVIRVTRHNRVAFAIVDIEFLDTILATLEILEDPGSMAALAKSIEDIKRGRLHDHEDVKRELL